MTLPNIYLPWYTQEEQEPAELEAQTFARAYEYILGPQWGKGTPLADFLAKPKKQRKKKEDPR